MEKVKKNQVLEILEYWKLIEFLGQIDIPEESSDNKKLIEKIRNGEKVSEGKVEIFMDVVSPYIEIEKLLEQNSEEFRNYSTTGDEITFCLGKIERNSVVEYLEKFIEEKEERPEIVYPKKSTIAWCSFKTDVEGLYLQESFQLSPILWAISVWEKTRMQKQHDFFLDINEYNDIVSKIDKELQEQNVSQFLASVYEQIFKDYIKKQFPDVSKDTMGFIAYNRYTNDEVRDGDEDTTDYADLGKSCIESAEIYELDKKQTENQTCPKCGKKMFEKMVSLANFLVVQDFQIAGIQNHYKHLLINVCSEYCILDTII